MKKDYLKEEAKGVITQKYQSNNANSKISEIDSILSSLQNEQNDNDILLDNLMADMENFLNNNSIEVSENVINENIASIENELNNHRNVTNISLVSEIDYIKIDERLTWDEYINNVHQYATKNNIDLELEYEKMFAFENIELIQINKGTGVSVICIDGFLTQNKDITDRWLRNLPDKYKEFNIYYCGWESKEFLDIAKSVFMPTLEKLLIRAPYLVPMSLYEILNIWKLAGDNASKAGKSLAGFIHNQEKDFILIGHSLGARVINSCIENLSKDNKCNIVDVFLLGGAVKNDISAWSNLSNIVMGTVYNYLSHNDKVLQILYKIGEGSRLEFSDSIGRNTINNLHVQNIDVSKYIKGHSEYHNNLSLLLDKDRL